MKTEQNNLHTYLKIGSINIMQQPLHAVVPLAKPYLNKASQFFRPPTTKAIAP